MDTLHASWESIRPHLGTIGLVATWAALGVADFRKRAHWRLKRFSDQVNFSLNLVAVGTLQLRTLLEVSTYQVWLNDYGVRLVLAAAEKTRADQPFILLSSPADMAFVKRAALNTLSNHFAGAFLAASLGLPVKTATYYFALTFENYADMRTRKFRVLLAEAEHLVAVFGPAAPAPALLNPTHGDRLRVLQLMARLASEPGADSGQILGRVQLGLPL